LIGGKNKEGGTVTNQRIISLPRVFTLETAGWRKGLKRKGGKGCETGFAQEGGQHECWGRKFFEAITRERRGEAAGDPAMTNGRGASTDISKKGGFRQRARVGKVRQTGRGECSGTVGNKVKKNGENLARTIEVKMPYGIKIRGELGCRCTRLVRKIGTGKGGMEWWGREVAQQKAHISGGNQAVKHLGK